MSISLALTIFALSFTFFNLITYLLTSRQRTLEERLKFALGTSHSKTVSKETSRASTNAFRSIKFLSRPPSAFSRKYLDRIQLNLIKAGVPLKAEEMILINLVSLLVLLGLGLFFFKQAFEVLLLGAMGVLLPWLWLSVLKGRRVKRFEGQLLDAVLLLANALRAGHSFVQGLEIISRDMQPPLSVEFNRVSRDTKIGLSLEEALANLTRRVESKDLEMVVTGVLIQREVGGNMAEILDNIAHTIDKRIKNRAKIKALTAQTRASAWIISILPFALGGYIFGSHPEFSRIMLVDPMGMMMLAGALVMMILGILVIRVVIRIDI